MGDIVPSLHVSSVLIKSTKDMKTKSGRSRLLELHYTWYYISGLALYSGLGTENNNGFKLTLMRFWRDRHTVV